VIFISIKDTNYGLLGDYGSKSIISHNPMCVQQMVSKIQITSDGNNLSQNIILVIPKG